MKETAERIRRLLRSNFITNRRCSVRCKSNWVIEIRTKDETCKKAVRKIAEHVYQQESHHWLVLDIDGYFPEIPGEKAPDAKQTNESGAG